eukprot:9097965-Pyramimonas_sp.AAC.2
MEFELEETSHRILQLVDVGQLWFGGVLQDTLIRRGAYQVVIHILHPHGGYRLRQAWACAKTASADATGAEGVWLVKYKSFAHVQGLTPHTGLVVRHARPGSAFRKTGQDSLHQLHRLDVL